MRALLRSPMLPRPARLQLHPRNSPVVTTITIIIIMITVTMIIITIMIMIIIIILSITTE